MPSVAGQSQYLEALARMGPRQHLCLIYATAAEQFAAVVPYLRLGLERGERCLYIADENTSATVIAALQQGGIDTGAAISSGALVILTARETYLRDGRFDPERMIAYLAESVAAARTAGFSVLRATGEMTWVLGVADGDKRLLEYEARLNDFLPDHDVLALCQYNQQRFAPEALLEIIRAHPLIVHGTSLCHNPCFVPARHLVRPLPAAEKVDRLLTNLQSLAEEQEAGRRREELLSRILETSPAGILLVNREGRIVFANPRAEAVLGLPREALLGRAYNSPEWQISDEAGQPNPDAELPFRRVLASGRALDDARHVIAGPNGRRVHLTINASPLFDAAGEIEQVVFAIEDITELSRAETALRQSEAALREAQRLAHLGSWDWDAKDDSITWSEEYYRIYNLDPRLPPPGFREHLEVYKAESAQRLEAAVSRTLASGAPYELVLELVSSAAGQQWILARGEAKRAADGRITGLRGTAQDVTASKRAEDELLKLSSAIEQSPVSIIITDVRGLIEYVNPRFTQLTGYAPAEARGRNPRFLKSGYTSAEEYGVLWKTIASGQVWQGEFRNRKKNGELFWEHATIAPVKDAQGEVGHYIAIKEDITARKQLEEELRHAQKMEAIGQLAGGIAHDFNNILTAIIGYTTLIDMKMAEEDPLRSNIRQVLVAANRAAELTQSLLTFSRKQVISPQPIDLNRAIRTMEQFLRRVIGEDIELKTVLGAQPLTAVVDRGQLDQVLMNLAANARDAMPNGGMVTISTRTTEIDSGFILNHGFGKAGTYALLTIADTGEGMDEATRQQIFQPFFTTKEQGKGTGLGLAMVYGTVKQHGGFITVASTPGRGTIFDIYLPLGGEEAAARKVPPAAEETVRGGEETILVADDDSSLRTLATQVLSQFGYTVFSAADGEEALECFRQEQERLQLVILDAVMPKKSGTEVLEEIRKLRPDLKVLFISGYPADSIQRHGIPDPRLEFIQKPMGPQALLKKVRQVLDGPSDEASSDS